MRTEIDLVDTVRIAAPCSASWEAMQGDEQKRFCEVCGLHVHNLSAMTRREAQNLLQQNPDQLCIRFGQRSDGVVVTDSCPPRLRPVRALLLKRFAAIASFGLLLFNLTCRTVEAMQKTHAKVTKSKTATKQKPRQTVRTVEKPVAEKPVAEKPVSRQPMILGRRIVPHHPVKPAAPPPLMGVPVLPQSPKGHAPDASEANPPAATNAETKAAATEANATVFTLGVGSNF